MAFLFGFSPVRIKCRIEGCPNASVITKFNWGRIKNNQHKNIEAAGNWAYIK
jgi:hypothetical protein